MPTSNASTPVALVGKVPPHPQRNDPNPLVLPQTGYTPDQLTDYVSRQLGAPTWNVELTPAQIQDQIQDALGLYSSWLPIRRAATIPLIRGVFEYLKGADVGLGVADVSFVEPNPVPTEIFYGNLINPAPLFRTGLDEYDVFLRWRKTWQRVTSIRPDWFYDDFAKTLYIHNPIERYQVGIICFFPYTNTSQLNATGALWVKEYALEKSRYLLGDIWMKYSGAVPGPVKDIQLDAAKRDKAEERLNQLREQLKGMQSQAGIFVD